MASYFIGYLGMLGMGMVTLRGLARRDYRLRGSLSHLTALIQAGFFFLYGGFPAMYLPGDWPRVVCPPVQKWVALACIWVGLSIIVAGMVQLGLARSVGLGQDRLITWGLYRYSRNPQASGCGLYVLGFVLLWPSWFALGWGLLYPVLIHTMIRTEEDHLSHRFGSDYERYCQRVPRYFGIRPLFGLTAA